MIHSSTSAVYHLSLHDALPISTAAALWSTATTTATTASATTTAVPATTVAAAATTALLLLRCGLLRRSRGCSRLLGRSEEHTSELQSRLHLVCRLLLEKKKINQ